MLNEKAAARLMNSVLSSAPDSCPQLRKAWIDDAGRMCATNSYIAFRIGALVAGVPDQDAKKAIDLDRIWPRDNGQLKPLELPTLAELRAMMEEDRRKARAGEENPISGLYTFGTGENGEQLPAVNIAYLRDMLTMFPDAQALYISPIKPILFQCNDGDGLIVPMRLYGKAFEAERRTAPALRKRDKAPALGLRTFAALYA